METIGIFVAGTLFMGMCMTFGSILSLFVLAINELFCGGE